MTAPLPVCLFLSTSIIGGTERMALEFIANCDRSRIRPHVMILLEGGPLAEEVEKLLVPCCFLKWKGRLDRAALHEMKRFLGENGIKLIHNFGLRADLVGRLFSPAMGVERIVSGIRDTDPWRRFHHVWADRLTAHRVDLYIANSVEAANASLRRERMPLEKMLVIHNGVPLPEIVDPSVARAAFDIPPDRGPLVAMVANLKTGKKGHDVLFEALPPLVRRFPKMLVVCAGRDLSAGAIPRAASSLGDVVRFTGYTDKTRLLLQAADVAVLPSRFESFPASIVEAMAAGRAVVASRVGGIPEIIEDNVNGLLVPPGAPKALEQALLCVLEDETLRARLGDAARATVEERFTVSIMTHAIEDAYLGLFADP